MVLVVDLATVELRQIKSTTSALDYWIILALTLASTLHRHCIPITVATAKTARRRRTTKTTR